MIIKIYYNRRNLFMLTMKDLEKCFEEAVVLGEKYVAIKVHMDGFPSDEIIVNDSANFEKKLEYYKSAYDENLNHKFSKGVSIVGFVSADYYEDIEFTLVME
jgi:hypothetical protein